MTFSKKTSIVSEHKNNCTKNNVNEEFTISQGPYIRYGVIMYVYKTMTIVNVFLINVY